MKLSNCFDGRVVTLQICFIHYWIFIYIVQFGIKCECVFVKIHKNYLFCTIQKFSYQASLSYV